MDWLIGLAFLLTVPVVSIAFGTFRAYRLGDPYLARIALGVGWGIAGGWISCCMVILGLAWSLQ